jgi:SAM-dependent methyltransferase
MEAAATDQHLNFVGVREEYDLMGAMQFSVMCALGLRDGHRLLDIGCGSLRAGRLFIPYLAPGNYTGLEPNRWLVEEAIDRELGRELMALRAPTFLHNETFDVSGQEPFDFVLAQSIATHTGPEMTRALFGSIRDALAPSGVAAVTFIHGPRDTGREGWEYMGVTPYRRSTRVACAGITLATHGGRSRVGARRCRPAACAHAPKARRWLSPEAGSSPSAYASRRSRAPPGARCAAPLAEPPASLTDTACRRALAPPPLRPYSPSSSRSVSSSSSGTPRRSALASLEPGLSPATT